jgi:hypothetical protein
MNYIHPNRTSKNIEGDFYTTGCWLDGKEYGDCLDCAMPEAEAPTLLANIYNEDTYTHFIKQPETHLEILQACSACEVCCVSALRYSGKNTEIIRLLGNNPEYCDYINIGNNQLVQSLDSKGEYNNFSKKYIKRYYFRKKLKYYLSFRFVKRCFKKLTSR